jgi:hypothetical protein
MGRALGLLGYFCLVLGALLIVANGVMSYLGLSASFNIGDPSKFQFILISFWHIGAGLVAIGALAAITARRM